MLFQPKTRCCLACMHLHVVHILSSFLYICSTSRHFPSRCFTPSYNSLFGMHASIVSVCIYIDCALYFSAVHICFRLLFLYPGHAARSALLELRRAPGPRLSGWSKAHRDAVLHERRRHALHADEKCCGKGRCIDYIHTTYTLRIFIHYQCADRGGHEMSSFMRMIPRLTDLVVCILFVSCSTPTTTTKRRLLYLV